jgi:hypothetical protein
VLSDQCFPPVAPADGDGDCLAIIQIENGDLSGLVTAFLDLVTGHYLPVGSVVLLSATALLLRIGPAVEINYILYTMQSHEIIQMYNLIMKLCKNLIVELNFFSLSYSPGLQDSSL